MGPELVLVAELILLFSEFSLVRAQLHLLQLPKHPDNRHRDSQGEPTDCSESFLNLPHFWARKQLLGLTVALLAVWQPLVPHRPNVVVAL